MVKPMSKGRQRLEMRKIQNKSSLGVTFTKRRNGIFKKANELVTLCGAELAIIIFSPGKKPYSFGHPNVYTILNRILYLISDSEDLPANGVEKPKDTITQLFAQYNAIQKQAELERNNAKLEKLGNPDMELPAKDQLGYDQAFQLHSMVLELKMRVSTELQRRILMEDSSAPGGSSAIPAPGNNYGVEFNNLIGSYGEANFIDPNNYYGVGFSELLGAPEGNIPDPTTIINHADDQFNAFGASGDVNIPSLNYGTWEF